jgi:hypothetical protein
MSWRNPVTNIGSYRGASFTQRADSGPDGVYPGLPERDQHRAGRPESLGTNYATFQDSIRHQLGRMLGAGGFGPVRGIIEITVDRRPHGQAHE